MKCYCEGLFEWQSHELSEAMILNLVHVFKLPRNGSSPLSFLYLRFLFFDGRLNKEKKAK